MKFKKLNYLIFIVVAAVFIFIIWTSKTYGLDVLVKISSVVGSFSLLVAVATYFNKKRSDQESNVFEQIMFFREKIIPEALKVEKLILSKYPHHIFTRIEIKGTSIDKIKEASSVNFEHQLKIFFDSTKEPPSEWEDIEIRNAQMDLLNLIEEFSLKVKNFGIDKNLVLGSIYSAFIQIVERNTVMLFFTRDIMTNDNSICAATLSLYSSWKPMTERTNTLKNLWKYGLITKQQKEAIYDRKREYIEKSKISQSK